MSKRKKSKPHPAALPAARVRMFRILALLSPLLLLLLLEIGLRAFGFGYSPKFFQQIEINGAQFWTGNREFGRRFFPKILARSPHTFAFPITKPSGTKRIFILGESAALGDPLPEFGFSRMLDRLLTEGFPSNRFEVINVSVTAINSHVILPIARECATKDGDLWIIYMGNNEVVGPFGAGTVFGAQTPPLRAIRANLWFKTTRVGQLCDELLQKWRAPKNQEYWKGMELLAQQRVPSFDPRMTNIYANFERNLSDMLAAAKCPVILSTVAVNQRDCPPFASGSSKNELHNAEMQFRLATEMLKSNRVAEAKILFQNAVDEDALRFRADSIINQIIRRNPSNARLLDAEKILATNSNPHVVPPLGGSPDRALGISGQEFFLEHVHFTMEGNYQLARAIAAESEAALGLAAHVVPPLGGPDRPKPEPEQHAGQGTNWLTLEQCAAAIGFTDWNRSKALRLIIDRMSFPPFVGTLDLTNRIARLQKQDQLLREKLQPATYQALGNSVVQAARKYPEDWELHYNAGVLLSMGGDYPRAIEELKTAIQLMPLAPDPYFSLGGIFAFQKKNHEAVEWYEKALHFGENFDVLVRLGVVEYEQRNYTRAILHLERALRAKPDSVGARIHLGASFLQTGKREQAQEQFREALKYEPDNTEIKEMLKRAGG